MKIRVIMPKSAIDLIHVRNEVYIMNYINAYEGLHWE